MLKDEDPLDLVNELVTLKINKLFNYSCILHIEE